MSDINGHSKQPLGAIDNFPITIDGIVIPAEVDVTEARTYNLIVGMDWLNKINAKIDLKKNIMIFDWNGKEGKVIIKFIHEQRNINIEESEESDSETSSSESSDDEFEIEDQDLGNRNFLCWMSDKP